MGYEKLRVYQYQRGLDYASWTHSMLGNIEQSAAVLDHWDQAAEGIVENLPTESIVIPGVNTQETCKAQNPGVVVC